MDEQHPEFTVVLSSSGSGGLKMLQHFWSSVTLWIGRIGRGQT